ncbi:ATP-binding cassette domain-containing protein [Kiritimatiella glycovorans]|uniref:Peptide ABC transporter ATP-binding protein n=1 Tax=Kiritimatiella glycovorans TaxID=1307763 RepID=A0A0G3EG22_9BACT|nr:ABC transporter ATP-binding protein [Kiritimatiella glycovorans]AKJ65391.1 Peptide ABC transporter ATP-binding protein [Kiritimatiella glycovorans]
MAAGTPLLEVEDLRVTFSQAGAATRAVDGISFSVGRGETVALVGESGSGKSVTALALGGLVPPPGRVEAGRIRLGDQRLEHTNERELSRMRGNRLAYIFQEPAMALNPVFRIGWQIAEAIKLHRRDVAVRPEIERLLERVRLPSRVRRAYPHELSGGMQQRAMLAMALACDPELLVADEPTTALDVTVQEEILKLLVRLRGETGMSILLITHNFGLVSGIAERLYVMNAGRIVEHGPTGEVLRHPRDAYTRRLIDAIPRLHPAGE